MIATAPRVAVIIVNYNAGEHLRRVLDGLAAQRRPADRVIVVDNGSTDDSLDRLTDHLTEVEVEEPDSNIGFAAGNNYGVRVAADCDWIAFLNPDAIPEPDWLSALLAATRQHSSTRLFASAMLVDGADHQLDGTGDIYSAGGLALRRDHGAATTDGAPAGPVFGACGAAALVGRDDFIGLGGFCERFFCYYEDVDLAFRLRLDGGECRYVPLSRVHHVGSFTTGRESDFTLYHTHRNMVWTFVSNMPRGVLWRSLPEHLLLNLLTVAWFSARGNAGTMFRAKRDALKGLRWALRRRRQIQARRVATDDEIRATFSPWNLGWGGALRRAISSVRGSSAGRMR